MENQDYQTPPQFSGNAYPSAGAPTPDYSQNPLDKYNNAPIMTVKNWLITMLISIIPIVNIVFWFIWAFGDQNVNPNKSSWAKATLIILAIGIVLQIILYAAFGSMFMSMAELGGGDGAYL